MKNEAILVIHEFDFSDGENSVIGLASTVEKANLMIEEYYGKENFTEESYVDIRDCNLEYSKILNIKGNTVFDAYQVKIVTEWLNVDVL